MTEKSKLAHGVDETGTFKVGVAAVSLYEKKIGALHSGHAAYIRSDTLRRLGDIVGRVAAGADIIVKSIQELEEALDVARAAVSDTHD